MFFAFELSGFHYIMSLQQKSTLLLVSMYGFSVFFYFSIFLWFTTTSVNTLESDITHSWVTSADTTCLWPGQCCSKCFILLFKQKYRFFWSSRNFWIKIWLNLLLKKQNKVFWVLTVWLQKCENICQMNLQQYGDKICSCGVPVEPTIRLHSTTYCSGVCSGHSLGSSLCL